MTKDEKAVAAHPAAMAERLRFPACRDGGAPYVAINDHHSVVDKLVMLVE